MIINPQERATAIDAEIKMLAAATAKTAWGEKHGILRYETISDDARSILEECVVRGIHIGMTWGPA